MVENLGEKFVKTVTVIKSKYDVFIQTDKAIYKQGDKVQFRVLVINKNLKPFKFKSMKITINDGENTEILNRNYHFSDSGFIEDWLQLNESHGQGKWKIQAAVDESSQKIHSFEVNDYLLTDYEVSVVPEAKQVFLSQKRVEVKVLAKSITKSCQKSVEGMGMTSLVVVNEDQNLRNALKIEQTRDSKLLILRFENLKFPENSNKIKVKLQGIFEDQQKTKSYSAIETIIIYKSKEETLEIIPDFDYLNPGKMLNFKIEVKNFDGTLLQERKQIELKILQESVIDKNADENSQNLSLMKLPAKKINLVNGIAEFTVGVSSDIINLVLGVQYDEKNYVHKMSRLPAKRKENLSLKVTSTK